MYLNISASLFFVTYEGVKFVAGNMSDSRMVPLVHMTAASMGEVVRAAGLVITRKYLLCNL